MKCLSLRRKYLSIRGLRGLVGTTFQRIGSGKADKYVARLSAFPLENPLEGCHIPPAFPRRTPTRWLTDQRGVAVLTYAVVLPLFLLLIFGAIEVWKVMAVRQSLRLGTYQAARALSWQGRNLVEPPVTPPRWQAAAQPVAEAIVTSEVARNNLAGGAAPQVSVEPPAVPDCEQVYALESDLSVDAVVFSITGTLGLPSPVKIPFVQPVTMTLTVRHLGFLECPEGWNPDGPGPPPEGHAY